MLAELVDQVIGTWGAFCAQTAACARHDSGVQGGRPEVRRVLLPSPREARTVVV